MRGRLHWLWLGSLILTTDSALLAQGTDVQLCVNRITGATRYISQGSQCRFYENAITIVQGGLPGPQGPMGPTGPVGPQGPIGPQGPEGAAGPIGLSGPQGAEGPQGPIGPRGTEGPQGPTGPQGIPGPQGPAGRDGIPTSAYATSLQTPVIGIGEVLQLNVPAGTYVVQSSIEARFENASALPWSVGCSVRVEPTLLDFKQFGFRANTSSATTLSLLGVHQAHAPTTILLRCAGSNFSIASANLVAIRVGELHIQP